MKSNHVKLKRPGARRYEHLKPKAIEMLLQKRGRKWVAKQLGCDPAVVVRWAGEEGIRPLNATGRVCVNYRYQSKIFTLTHQHYAWKKEWVGAKKLDDHWAYHPEAIKAATRSYYHRNKSQTYSRIKSNPTRLVRLRLRSRVYSVLKGLKKSAPTMEMLGCSLLFFKQWLESGFIKRMTWENCGSYWHIDHIIPCAEFDLTKPDEQRRCFHYSNLRPLEAKKNLQKHANFTTAQPQLQLQMSK